MRWRLLPQDRRFLVEVLMPGYRDKAQAADLLASDENMIARMVDDERLFQHIVADDEVLVHASPWLFFLVLLRRARREMAQETFTVEQRDRQKVVLFDVDQVNDLLDDDAVVDYLASLLASFTRVESITVRYQVREGVWHRFRTSELNVEGLIRFAQTMEERFRFQVYKRIGDVCLFLTGMFPEYIESRYRYASSGQIRPSVRARLLISHEDYESHGRAFYRLAAEHEMAQPEGTDGLLAKLGENFVLAEKPLRFVANRYLQFTRHRLFDV